MGMFVKDAAHPLGDREEEHVVAECIRPIRDGHAHSMTGDQTAGAEQEESHCSGQDDKQMERARNHGTNDVLLNWAGRMASDRSIAEKSLRLQLNLILEYSVERENGAAAARAFSQRL